MCARPEVNLHVYRLENVYMFSSLTLAGANHYSSKQHWQVSGGSMHQGLVPKGSRIV